MKKISKSPQWECSRDTGIKTFYGKMDKTLPSVGELNPDIVAAALGKIMKVKPKSLPAGYVSEIQKAAPKIPPREQTFCPGCPHAHHLEY